MKRITKAVVFLFLIISWSYLVVAASEGMQSGHNLTDNSSVGTLTWPFPSEANASDDSWTQISTTSTAYSHYLIVQDTRFSIPSTATINGIEVIVEKVATHNATGSLRVEDREVSLVKDNVIVGDNKSSVIFWPTIEENITYGSSSDTWGVSWTVDNINNASFGVAIRAYIEIDEVASVTGSVDYIGITVYYETCTPPASNNDWIVIAVDNCNLSSQTVDLGTGVLYLDGSQGPGHLKLTTSNITSTDMTLNGYGSIVRIILEQASNLIRHMN